MYCRIGQILCLQENSLFRARIEFCSLLHIFAVCASFYKIKSTIAQKLGLTQEIQQYSEIRTAKSGPQENFGLRRENFINNQKGSLLQSKFILYWIVENTPPRQNTLFWLQVFESIITIFMCLYYSLLAAQTFFYAFVKTPTGEQMNNYTVFNQQKIQFAHMQGYGGFFVKCRFFSGDESEFCKISRCGLVFLSICLNALINVKFCNNQLFQIQQLLFCMRLDVCFNYFVQSVGLLDNRAILWCQLYLDWLLPQVF
eukprot:TRINITY_DN1356_c0_g1_i19.p1 TRINITY_DN1356_c0_g1~~TRINITY_DN1356_c0_g1_i19.p1  ORF type:complete len:256 (-),score=4.95 TRINITY_DN1356_c0_g1_i19:604-1371(-)